MKYFLRRLISVLLSIAVSAFASLVIPQEAFAAPLTNTSVTLSNSTALSTGVSFTYAATTASSGNMGQIDFYFTTTSLGNTKPSHLDLSSATLVSTTGLGSGWTINTTDTSGGVLHITNGSPPPVTAGTGIEIVLGGIKNSAIDDCEPGNNGLVDTCYTTMRTNLDNGADNDSATLTYTVHELPALSFSIEGIAVGETHNGVTTTTSTAGNTLPFSKLAPGQVMYATHKLTVTTNAPGGYQVTAVLNNNLHGQYNNAEIDPFAGVDATWTTPQNWSTPDGIEPNNNTGWIGANTSDIRVAGWTGGSGKFGPFGTTPRIVAFSDVPDASGSTIYVSYALEVNGAQPADLYTGTVTYSIQANY